MVIPHRKLSIDINRPNQYTVDFIAHVGDKNTRYIDITFNADGEPIELEQGCAATVTYVSDGVLIEQEAECDVNGSTVIVGIDTEKVKSLRSGILEVQPKIVDSSGNIIVSQIPVFVRISPDIAEHGHVDDDSLGSYAEVVREIAAARGTYANLKERLDHTGAPTDEQVAEAVEGYLGEHSGEIFNDAIIGNFDILTPDIEFEVTNDDVKNYLTSADYTFAVDYAYNGTDYASTNVPSTIDSAVNERPNGGQIAIPNGGVKLTLYDTVANTKWSVNISGDTYTVKNLIPNRLYTYVITDIDDTVIKTGSCKASGQVRTIDAGKATTYYTTDPSTTFKRPIFNIRDLGGWACDGGRLKYGVIYRGCRLNGNYTSGQTRYGITISPAQIDFFKNFLGIRDEIDFRQVKDDPDLGNTETAGDDAEYETTDDIKDTALGIGVDYTIIPINPYLRGIEIKSDNAEMNRRYANVIKRIARDIEEGKPCYMHCLEGADRTGTVAMLILAICGVSRNDIERDYELTSFSKDYAGNRNRRARNDTAQSYRWMTLIQYLLGSAFSGSTFRDKIIDYVLKIGVTIEEINTIRAGLIDGEPEKISNPYADVAITYNLTNINTDNPISSIPMYQTFEAKLSALNTKSIQNVAVTMGGTDVTSSVYSQEKISIPKVTGNVIITAIASDIDVSGKADKSYVDTELAKKADKTEIPTKISAFTNDVGYLTQHQSLNDYYTKSETDQTFVDFEQFGNKQDKLTAGENITIEDNVISAEGGGVTSYNDLTDKPILQIQSASGTTENITIEDIVKFIPFYKDVWTGYINVDLSRCYKTNGTDTTSVTDFDSLLYGTYYNNSAKLYSVNSQGIPQSINAKNNLFVLYQFGVQNSYSSQLIFWVDSTTNDSKCAYRVCEYNHNTQQYNTPDFIEIGSGGAQIVSGIVNANGTITFTDSEGNSFTTSGESVIGPQGAPGQDYVLTAQDKQDIADIVLSELPTTEGVLYGNQSN